MEKQYCEHCGNEIIEARFTSPTVKHRFCSTQCTEDFYNPRTTAKRFLASSGSVAAPKHSTCSDIPLPLEPTECREIRPAITWEEIRNLHKENEEIKLFLEDIRRIAFNGFSYKDRILDIQKKFPSR